jgi:hypothetical protein
VFVLCSWRCRCINPCSHLPILDWGCRSCRLREQRVYVKSPGNSYRNWTVWLLLLGAWGVPKHLFFSEESQPVSFHSFHLVISYFGTTYMLSIHILHIIFFGALTLSFGLCFFNFSIGFCTILFAAAAVIGYKMFGESTESQFTLNLPENLVVSKIAIWTTVIAVV